MTFEGFSHALFLRPVVLMGGGQSNQVKFGLKFSEVKPDPLYDDTERYNRSRIKTLYYASYTQLVRMIKIIRCRRPVVDYRPEALA